MTCRAIRQSDEVYCPNCGLRWSLNEDRPECPLPPAWLIAPPLNAIVIRELIRRAETWRR